MHLLSLLRKTKSHIVIDILVAFKKKKFLNTETVFSDFAATFFSGLSENTTPEIILQS